MTEPTKKYDVFLSHSSADKEAVEALAVRLRQAKLKVFLDKWNLVPGRPWQEGLERALDASSCCAVFLGKSGPGPWHEAELRLALDRLARKEMVSVLTVLLPGGKEAAADVLRSFLGQLTWVEFAQGEPSEGEFDRLVRGIVGAEVEPGEERDVPAPRVATAVAKLNAVIQGLEALQGLGGDMAAARDQLLAQREALLAGALVRVRGASVASAPWGAGPHAEALKSYFQALAQECSRLPLLTIDAKFVNSAGETPLGLDRVYVDLDVVAAVKRLGRDEEGEAELPERAARGLREGGAGRAPVLDALAAEEARFAVLLGDAGSGKTTFVHYLTILLARGEAGLPEAYRGLVPVRLVLRDVARAHLPAGGEGTAEALWEAVAADVRRRLGKEDSEAVVRALRARVLHGGGLFVLDGLDEVPEAEKRRAGLLKAVSGLADGLGPGSRVLVTARPYAYADRAWRLQGFQVFDLAPFSREQIGRFIARWYEAVRPNFQWSEATAAGRGRELGGAIRERDYLAKLAERPLLLTLMATLHSSWGRLPDDRADLYKEIVQLLLGRWQRARMASGEDGKEVPEPGISEVLRVGEEAIRQRLEELAFRTHESERRAAAQPQEAADIPEGEVLLAFKPLLGTLAPDVLLAYLRHRAGLLVERRPGVYAFPHRSFQEYLAASYLSERPDADMELRHRVVEDPAWWREVFLLAVGKARQGGLSRAVATIENLLAAPPEGSEPDLAHRLAALAGEALVELRLEERAGADLPVYRERAVDLVRRRLAALVEGGHLPPRERLAAGLSLGWLGDPRRGVGRIQVGGREIPEIEWCEIPAGSFRMGSPKGEKGARENEQPQCTVSLPSFFLSRFPVTNAQYGAFVESGGYERQELWTPEGWAWRRGDELDLSALDEDERKQFQWWLKRRPVEERDRPDWWDGPRRTAAACPVVGVTWFEAQAFCRWLDEAARQTPWWREREAALAAYSVRLPTEAEWERAARGGQVGRWPWGDDFGEGRANTAEAGLGRTSPVGLFPAGRNLFGLEDLAGNVWEWTSSLHHPHPYLASDGREEPHHLSARVLRGGSWSGASWFARCAARYGYVPSFFDVNLGFRCGVFPGLPSSS